MARFFKHTLAAEAHGSWAVRLQVAIVRQAVQDYRMAIRFAKGRRGQCYNNQPVRVAELSRWFRSPYGDMLCCGRGDEIARRIEREEGYAPGIE